ncbi:odorant binding protein 6 [Nomia melanderi]|uniref:odorant binding protein 6 n=1 Tax=Nomia melanderi TaxID=2448451 RepID=UPI003FCCA557
MWSYSVILVAALMLVLATIRSAESKKVTLDEAKNTVKNLRKPCAKKTDAPKDLLDGQHRGEFPKDERLMCYMKCILTTTKTIKNDEVQYEWFIKNARLMLEEKYVPRVEHVVEVCRNKVTAKEGCEVAWEFGVCVWETDSELYIAP